MDYVQKEVAHGYLYIRSFDMVAKNCCNKFSKSVFFGLLLKPGPRPWTRSLDPNPKNLDYEKRGKQLDAKKKRLEDHMI